MAIDLQGLLAPYVVEPLSEAVLAKLASYLDLLVKWNAKTNLTSVRAPEEMVRRHFGESLFLAKRLPAFTTLLDFGSGAGFPGIPVQLIWPQSRVTLAESQGKKASFLREAVRVLDLPGEVFGGRVETLPSDRVFEIVTMRAVDDAAAAFPAAVARVSDGGFLAVLAGREFVLPEGFSLQREEEVPGGGKLVVGKKK